MAVNEVSFPTVFARDLEAPRPEHHWLIEGLWAQGAIGLIGGPPKCAKTWFGLDMAVSIASGTPAIGYFAVDRPGRSLVYLAEDALTQLRARVESLCLHRRIDIRALDLLAITAPIVRLDLPDHRERLARTIEKTRPQLLLLDPLIRMHRRDENSAAEMSELLSYLRELQRTFDLAVALVHHASKKQRAQPGQALRGSSDLHALGDCNAYLARRGEDIVLTIEHRAAPSPKPLTLALLAEPDGSATHLEVCRGERRLPSCDAPLDAKILELLELARRPMHRTQIREQLQVNNQRLGEVLLQLEIRGRLARTSSGWMLPNASSSIAASFDKPTPISGETEAGSAEEQPAKG